MAEDHWTTDEAAIQGTETTEDQKEKEPDHQALISQQADISNPKEERIVEKTSIDNQCS